MLHIEGVVEKEIVYETVYKEKEGSGAPPEGYLSPAEIAAKIQAKEEEIMSKVTKEMAARQVPVCWCIGGRNRCVGVLVYGTLPE